MNCRRKRGGQTRKRRREQECRRDCERGIDVHLRLACQMNGELLGHGNCDAQEYGEGPLLASRTPTATCSEDQEQGDRCGGVQADIPANCRIQLITVVHSIPRTCRVSSLSAPSGVLKLLERLSRSPK